MKTLLHGILVALPILVIGYCCWFFTFAFNKTIKQCDNETPLVQVSVENDCAKKAVLRLLCKDSVKDKVGAALTERERIVENVHTRFRAELATWLSIFGLLTVIVSLVVPVCAHLLQQREFQEEIKNVKSLLEKTEKKYDDNFSKMENRYKEILTKVDMAEKAKTEAIDAKSAAENAAAAAEGPEETESVANPVSAFPWSDSNLKSKLYNFKILWGAGKVEQKIQAGISLFEACDKAIGEALEEKDEDKLVKCINILNNVNAYIGTRNLEYFRPLFITRLKEKHPINHSPDQVEAVLKGRLPQSGFYNTIWELQIE